MDEDLLLCGMDKKDLGVVRNILTSPIAAVSGGFAIVQPGSQLSINAVEGFPLEEFSSDVIVPTHPINFVLP